ncbi:MAG: glycine zipper 2TM domain-containing protein [Campylobacterota bacterium]|nr:glycine zipper 2TM domain-containing protein [Campylobacterota bacterium]
MKTKILMALAILATFANAEMIRVTESVAISKPYTKKVKTGENCYEQTIEQYVNCGGRDTNSIGIDTIIGATLGVVIGHQVGGGSGRDAAKILGGLGGGYIANQQRNQEKCKTYNQVTKCDPVYEYITEERVIGYKNCAFYKGQKVCKESSSPLEYLNVSQKIYVH